MWAGQLSRYSDQLRAGRSGDRIPVGARFSAPVQTGPGAHPASCTMGTGSFPGVKSGRGVTLTPYPLLVPLVMKEQSYTSTPPMGCTACTEPQCLYKGALYLYLQTRVVIGLLTGHNTLRRHLHIMGLCNDPMCRKCGTEEETSVHILCECEALASPRHAYLGSFFFFWTLGTYGNYVWGPSGSVLKEQGSYSLAQNMGHRGPDIKAQVYRA